MDKARPHIKAAVKFLRNPSLGDTEALRGASAWLKIPMVDQPDEAAMTDIRNTRALIESRLRGENQLTRDEFTVMVETLL